MERKATKIRETLQTCANNLLCFMITIFLSDKNFHGRVFLKVAFSFFFVVAEKLQFGWRQRNFSMNFKVLSTFYMIITYNTSIKINDQFLDFHTFVKF